MSPRRQAVGATASSTLWHPTKFANNSFVRQSVIRLKSGRIREFRILARPEFDDPITVQLSTARPNLILGLDGPHVEIRVVLIRDRQRVTELVHDRNRRIEGYPVVLDGDVEPAIPFIHLVLAHNNFDVSVEGLMRLDRNAATHCANHRRILAASCFPPERRTRSIL